MLGPLDSVTCKEAVLFTGYTDPLDPRRDLTPKKFKGCKKKIMKNQILLFHDLEPYVMLSPRFYALLINFADFFKIVGSF